MSIPFVSVIVPCKNEEGFINRMLDSVILNDYPKDRLEIIILDGISTDGTFSILSEYEKKYKFIKVLENPEESVSFALNKGIKAAKGEIIIRMDAHCVYDVKYISQSVNQITQKNVDNVGGAWLIEPGAATTMAKAIALALSNPFGVGNAFYRIGLKKEKYVDTVPFGCFKKKLFDRIGFFDEHLVRGQDTEFNARIIKYGGKILFDPVIVSHYFSRKTLLSLSKMYLQYGYFKPYVAKKIGRITALRQLVPIFFIFSLILFFILSFLSKYFFYFFLAEAMGYIIVNLLFSLYISLKNRPIYLVYLPIIFMLIHFCYAFGYINGIKNMIILKKPVKKSNFPLTR